MIKFPEKVQSKYYPEDNKIVKEYLKELEETLRKLGNFKTDEPIEVIDNNDYDNEKYTDCLYEVKDLDGTSFIFNNFLMDNNVNYRRFQKNYHLLMKRKDSKYYYKYQFDTVLYDDFIQKLRVMKISYELTENRVIKLSREIYRPIIITLEEENKQYQIVFYDNSEKNDTFLLKDFENIITRALYIETLNVENIIKIIGNPEKISFINVLLNKKLKARIEFGQDVSIKKYIINEGNKTTRVSIDDKINRTVERDYNGKIISYNKELEEEDYESFQEEYNELLKRI